MAYGIIRFNQSFSTDDFSDRLLYYLCNALDKIDSAAQNIYQEKIFKNLFKLSITSNHPKAHSVLMEKFKVKNSPKLLAIYIRELSYAGKASNDVRMLLINIFDSVQLIDVEFILKCLNDSPTSLIYFALSNNICHKKLINIIFNYCQNNENNKMHILNIIDLLSKDEDESLLFGIGCLAGEFNHLNEMIYFIKSIPLETLKKFFIYLLNDIKYQVNHFKIISTCTDAIQDDIKILSLFENELCKCNNEYIILTYGINKVYSNKRKILVALNKCKNKFFINQFILAFPEYVKLSSFG